MFLNLGAIGLSVWISSRSISTTLAARRSRLSSTGWLSLQPLSAFGHLGLGPTALRKLTFDRRLQLFGFCRLLMARDHFDLRRLLICLTRARIGIGYLLERSNEARFLDDGCILSYFSSRHLGL